MWWKMGTSYNKTQLSPDKEFERHIFHRDQFAHYLRWSHVLKSIIGDNKVLDVGCGSGNLAEVLYRNRHKCNKYLGLDVRNKTIEKNNEKFAKIPWISFDYGDFCKEVNLDNDWDFITSFEVIEHIGKQNADKFLFNIKKCCNDNTIVMISTPNYDEKVGAAGNHTYDSGDGRGIAIHEFEFNELKSIIEKYFVITKIYGTFASQKDYKEWIKNSEYSFIFDNFKDYFDSNVLSVFIAPLIPPQMARNCLWILKKKR